MEVKKEIKVAIIDMNDGFPNLGMKGISSIFPATKKKYAITLLTEVFDLRKKK